MATVIPGEAPETDDDGDDNNDCIGRIRSEQVKNAGQNADEIRNWDMNEVQERSWSSHVDEKLEERWRTLGYDTVRLAEHPALAQRKQFKNLKQNLSNTQHAMQVTSSTFRQAAGNLEHVERNLSLLLDGTKLIPDFSNFSVCSNSSKESI